MALVIYNTLSRKKEEFKPLVEGQVKMYVCGPTVYGYLHVGNFFGPVFFNLVRNWLEVKGHEVSYIYNYTDVDDKIINRAMEEGVGASEISEKYIKEFEKDYASLKLRPHTGNPRVTEHMDGIIEFVKDLVEKDMAYILGGDVYFDVKSFPEYGCLSHRKIDDVLSGSRIEVNENKKHPADFALWKQAKDGEPSWKSPWGQGRPGWHIECSAMARSILGESIDIHGGGMDLIFPHHENEIAQSQALSDKTFARYWMHNNMLTFGDKKMSKSLGNIQSGRDFLNKYNGEILKMMYLSSHYRSTIDFTENQIHRSILGLAKIYSALAYAEEMKSSETLIPVPKKFQAVIDHAGYGISQALDDDFNTPAVMACLYEVIRSFNGICRKPGPQTAEQQTVAEVFFHWLRKQTKVLSLFQEPPKDFLLLLDDMLLEKKGVKRVKVDQMVVERATARKDKNFQRADELRDQLKELGISVQDSAQKSAWEVDKSLEN